MTEYLKKAWLFLVLFYTTLPVLAQKQEVVITLEKEVKAAIVKAQPACVYLNDYDPVKKELMGGRFSGVVVTPDGLILTAAHASVPSRTYKVTFLDGKICFAQGLGRIAAIDAAVLKIMDKGPWPYADMGRSSSLLVGQPCISLAYPACFDTNRLVARFGCVAEVSSLQKKNSIRTTLLMEPGDSGGPAFDLSGRVIGLHSSVDRVVENNFEVPIDLYRKYWNALQQAEDYDGLPIGEFVEPDTLSTKKLVISIEDVKKGIAAQESRLNNLTYSIESIINGKTVHINATLIDLIGLMPTRQLAGKSFLVSKNSMIGDNPYVELIAGKLTRAKVILRDERKDMVLIELPISLKNGVVIKNSLFDSTSAVKTGRFLLSPQPHARPVLGIIGTTQFNLPMKYRAGYSGAGTTMENTKVVINIVQPNTGAYAAKLRPGDQVLSINGVAIDNPDTYINEMRKSMPGDLVLLVRRNASGTDTVTIKMGKYPALHSDHPAEHFAGGKSEYRDGFDNVYVQDGLITSSECGGPVFDLDQKFMGINIARFSRTCTLIITPYELNLFIKNKFIDNGMHNKSL